MSQSFEDRSKDDRIFSIFAQRDLIVVWKVAKRNMVLQQCTEQLWMQQYLQSIFCSDGEKGLPEGIHTQNECAYGCRDKRAASDKLEMQRFTHCHAYKCFFPTCFHRENSVEGELGH